MKLLNEINISTRVKISSFILAIIVILLAAGSTIYAFVDYTGLSHLAKIGRLLILLGLVLITFLFLVKKQRMIWNPSIATFIILVVYGTVVSVVFNSPREYLPSLLRYMTYILGANLLFFLSKEISKSGILNFFKTLSYLFLIISIVFGFFEILSGQVDYINGDFRVAGPFRKHQLAFAMFLFANLILFIEFHLRGKTSFKSNFLKYLIFTLAFYLFIRTGSRALIVIFFLSYFGLFIFTSKSFKSILKTIIIGFSVFAILSLIIINTNISPRLKYIYTSQNSIYDPSTMTRILIITNSLEALDKDQLIYGIGLGGFTNFYYGISGRDNVAAHNNYLLFLVEAGIIGVFLFLIYQIVTFRYFLKLVRRNPNSISRSAFLMFIGIDVLCFLQNNYYFFTQELIVWMIYGVAFYLNKSDQLEDETETLKSAALRS